MQLTYLKKKRFLFDLKELFKEFWSDLQAFLRFKKMLEINKNLDNKQNDSVE